MKVVLITGASSGIGFDAAKALALKGYKVYAAARRTALMEPLREFGVEPLRMDLTDPASVDEAVSRIGSESGGIDILVNNAGYGYLGAIENVPLEEARKQMEVNLFGLAGLCRAVIPGMREKGEGRIVNVSSVAGLVPFYFGDWYNVSKYSVEALSDAMRIELKPFGIKVSIIEPGPVKTDWGIIAAKNLADSSTGTAYEKEGVRTADTFRKTYEAKHLFPGPGTVTRAIVKAVTRRRPRLRYRVGAAACLLVFFYRILPHRWWDNISRITSIVQL